MMHHCLLIYEKREIIPEIKGIIQCHSGPNHKNITLVH
uniref:Uncharacterized protein n=1 Tax=Anguilla anguilla TaxID=7936 RepID=A0A0E9REG1_ANGAN